MGESLREVDLMDGAESVRIFAELDSTDCLGFWIFKQMGYFLLQRLQY